MPGSDSSSGAEPPLRFSPLAEAAPGALAALLTESYGDLLATGGAAWRAEARCWAEFDREAFARPEVGACVFLSWVGAELVGFSSYDPRGAPHCALVGHNCVRPARRGRGIGGAQLRETVARLAGRGVARITLSTLALPFFAPARRMYRRAGFREVARRPWPADPAVAVLELELALVHRTVVGTVRMPAALVPAVIPLRSPHAQLEGCSHLPRFIDKTRLHLAGKLPAAYATSFCHPRGLDGTFLGHFGLAPEAIVEAIRQRADEAEIGRWFAATVADFAARREAWQRVAPRLGLPGEPMHEVFLWAMKNVYPECRDPACDTVFKVLDWDEGRAPAAATP